MRTSYQLQSVDVTEVICHFGAEHPASTTGVDCPVLDVLRVRPHQIAEGSLMGNLNFAVDGSHLVNGLDLGTESAMHAEHLSIDNCTNGQVIEDLSAVFPRIGVAILTIDLIIETIDSGDLSN
jgi:hypothetical protein